MVRQFRLRDQLALIASPPLLIATLATVLLIADGSSSAMPFGLLLIGALVVAVPVCVLAIRSVLSSVEAVSEEVERLAEAYRRHRADESALDDVQPLRLEFEGEVGRLADAVNGMHGATVEIGKAQRGSVQAGLSNIVVNMARRNQTLIDRQIEQLDHLEQTEEDPERLGHLFKVDHLATRMRRNAESLLVLAEADPVHRRGGPVEVGDVLRVAVGEVDAYENIDLADVDGGLLPPAAAVDLAHLAAELMENATQFSPPTAPVVVTGAHDGAGRYRVTIADQGIGLAPPKLIDANRTLADPPELNLDMGRSLGFMVVGRLAKRLGAKVVLDQDEGTGCRAVITIPDHVFVEGSIRPLPAAPVVEVAEPMPSVATQAGTTRPVTQFEPIQQPPLPDRTADRSASRPRGGSIPPVPQIATARQIPAPPLPPTESWPAPAVDDRRPGQQAERAVTDQPGDRDGDVFAWPTLGPSEPRADRPASPPATPAAPAPAPTPAALPAADGADHWTPPSVSPRPPDRLDQALPAGDAFEQGVASLLEPGAGDGRPARPTRPTSTDETPSGLARRTRGASDITRDGGRPVAASRRNPEEIRDKLSRYRQGLKGQPPGGTKRPSGDGPRPTDSNSGDRP